MRVLLWTLTLLFTLAAGRGDAAEVTLRLQHALPADSFVHTHVIQPWASGVTERSGGRLVVEVFPAMALGGQAGDLLEQAEAGTVDLVWARIDDDPERFLLLEPFELPFMTASAEAASQALAAFAGEEGVLAKSGAQPLLFHVEAPLTLHVAGRPIRSLADLAGTELSAMNGWAARTLARLGAEPHVLAPERLGPALGDGSISGALLSFRAAQDPGLAEAIKEHTVVPGFLTSAFVLAINRARYEALPEHLQAVLDAGSGIEGAAAAGRVFDQAEMAAIRAATGDRFFILHPMEVDHWRAAVQPVLDLWIDRAQAAGLDGRSLIARARTLLAEFARREES